MKTIFFSLALFLSLFIQSHAQVPNKGVGGNSTTELLKRIDEDVIQENPDLVILMVGTNDFLNSRKIVSYTEYAINFDSIVGQIKMTGSQVLLRSSPPVDSAYLFTRHDQTLSLCSILMT